MSTIKKIAALVILTLLCLSRAFIPQATANEQIGFSISPLSGILWGQGEEFLFKYRDGDQLVSELLWDLKPLVYLGVKLDVGPKDPFRNSGLISAGSVKFAIPSKTGRMEDRDWQYPDNERLTNYSEHDAYALNTLLADLSLGYSIMLNRSLALGLFGEISYMRFHWMAENGFLQYLATDDVGNILPGQTWTPDVQKIPIYGPGIRYIQNWYIITPGISLTGKPSDSFSIGGSVRYTPLVFGFDKDDHLYGMRLFSGRFQSPFDCFGHYLNGGVDFTFSPTERLSFSLGASYSQIRGMRGENTVLIGGIAGSSPLIGASFVNPFDAGAGYWAMELGLKARMRY